MNPPSLLLAALLVWSPLRAQERDGVWGSFSLVNAFAEGEIASLELDGAAMGDDRLDLGESTGNWPVRAGRHELRIDCGGEEPLVARFAAEPGVARHLVLFADYERDPDSGEIVVVPKVEPLPVQAAERFRMTLLSVARDEQVEVVVNDETIPVSRLSPEEIDAWHGQELRVSWRGDSLGRYEFSEPGAFLFLLYQDRESRLRLLLLRVVDH